jgi:phosphomannomutase
MKGLIIFKLDGSLAERKSELDGGEMVMLPVRLLGIVDVAIISGGAYGQFEKQRADVSAASRTAQKSVPFVDVQN